MLTTDYRKTPEFKWTKESPELYLKVLQLQNELREAGVAWHNPFSNECNADFSCCEGHGPGVHTFVPSIYTIQKDAILGFADFMGIDALDVNYFISIFLKP